MIQTVRVTRELFLPDADLRKALGLEPQVIILAVVRKQGTYRKGGVIDLQGSLVTVYDPKEIRDDPRSTPRLPDPLPVL